MYCSQCGKKVKDSMLFCPFCGKPIIIPDQDDETLSADASAAEAEVSAQAENLSVSTADYLEEVVPDFIPLNVDEADVWTPPTREEAFSEPEPEEEAPVREEPLRLNGHKPELSGVNLGDQKPKKVDAKVPQREFDPENLFMDEEKDGYDEYEDDEEYEYEYEEREEGGFFVRHIRGFVTLILFVIVAAVLTGWALSDTGQRTLAHAGFAWNADIYAEIAFEAYQGGNYSVAGGYYSNASSRDPESYDYANSAGVSYYMAQDMGNAEVMALRAIEINPARGDAYDLLLRLYPDPSACSAEIRSVFQKGYRLTGNAALNPDK